MKKILFMVSSFNIGGVEKSLISLLSAMPQEEVDVTVLTLEKKGGFLEYIPSWVKVEEAEWFEDIKRMLMASPYEILDIYKKQGKYTKIISFLMAYFLTKYTNDRSIYLKHLLKQIPSYESKFDVAVAYPGPTEIIDSYIIYKVAAKKKVGWIHFDLSQVKPNYKLYKKLYNQFDKLFIVSEEARQKVIDVFPNSKLKVETFKNIISTSIIQNLAKQPIEFDDHYTGTKIVTVGRLSYEKGQDLAIKVTARLKEEGYAVRWYCIGEGKNREEYEELIRQYQLEEDFILMGAKINPYPYMTKADLYVQTSRHEGFCLTLAEAKCLGKAIITTNFTGAREQIKDNQTGFIVEATEEALYKKIKWLLNHKEEQKRVSRNLQMKFIDTRNEINKLFQYVGEV